jgi:hypothetical protein
MTYILVDEGGHISGGGSSEGECSLCSLQNSYETIVVGLVVVTQLLNVLEELSKSL